MRTWDIERKRTIAFTKRSHCITNAWTIRRQLFRFYEQEMSEVMWPRLKEVLQPLSRDQIWWRPNEASNRFEIAPPAAGPFFPFE